MAKLVKNILFFVKMPLWNYLEKGKLSLKILHTWLSCLR